MNTIPIDRNETPGTITGPTKPFLKVHPAPKNLSTAEATELASSRVCAMTKILGPSWRTKLGAIFAAVAALSGQALYLLDDSPATNPDLAVILATLGGLYALFSARDNVVSSEKAGVK